MMNFWKKYVHLYVKINEQPETLMILDDNDGRGDCPSFCSELKFRGNL